jgi:hypothetical protein
MVRAAVLEHAQALERTSFVSVLDSARRFRFAGLLVGAVVLPTLFSLSSPATAALWAKRWLLGSNERWPQKTYLTIAGLDDDRIRAPRGEPLVVQVLAKPGSQVPDQISLRYRSESGSAKQGNFTRFGDNDFRYEIPPVQEPLHLTITGGDDWLGPIVVEPIDRPTIEKLTVRVLHDPVRPGGEIRAFNGTDAQLLFLRTTELELEVTSRVPLQSASLTARTGMAPPLQRIDARSYVARWTMTEALALELLLVGHDGGLSSKPYLLSIGLLKDREPRVTVRSSGVGPRVTAVARIPLSVRALDDFNLAQLGLELERSVPTEQEPEKKDAATRIDVDPPGADEATEAERQTNVLLRDLSVGPGTSIKLRGFASDNCAEGSQAGYSRWLTFRVVTPEELFHEILMRQRAERAKFRSALGTAKSQSDSLDTAVGHEHVDGLVRKHQVVERQVWQVASRLDESLTELKLNELGSPQALDLLQSQVITPMLQLHKEQMADMSHVLTRMVAEKDELDQHLPAARELQKQIVERMEQILNQMSQWESFVDVVNQLREIIKLEDSVFKSTDEAKKKKTKAIFDE